MNSNLENLISLLDELVVDLALQRQLGLLSLLALLAVLLHLHLKRGDGGGDLPQLSRLNNGQTTLR